MQRFTTIHECKTIWSRCSPAEKDQIRRFIEVNAWTKNLFFLAELRKDTGKMFVTAGLRLDPPGLSYQEIMGIVGEGKPVKPPIKSAIPEYDDHPFNLGAIPDKTSLEQIRELPQLPVPKPVEIRKPPKPIPPQTAPRTDLETTKKAIDIIRRRRMR